MPRPCGESPLELPRSSGSRLQTDLLEGSAGDDPALDVALPHALLNLVAQGRRPPVIRSYRPAPTVAFGRRDALLPGFANAAAAARRRGFAPVVRGAGGRAAAYHQGCLVFDEVMPAQDSLAGIHARFADDAGRQARALRTLGVDARVGEVSGEYCPGEFTVNARGKTKLIGAAQRIIRSAWLLSTVVVVDAAADIRAVLEDVYDELGLEWNPATTGSVADEVPGTTVEKVRDALLREYERRYRLAPATVAPADLAAARELLPRHRVDG
jgi:octanoyl-[GcvH]:protein N-octanoyltransferase